MVLTGTTPYGKCYYHGGGSFYHNITIPSAGTLTGGIITFSVNTSGDNYGFTFTGTTNQPVSLIQTPIVTPTGGPQTYSYRLYDAGAVIGWLVV